MWVFASCSHSIVCFLLALDCLHFARVSSFCSVRSPPVGCAAARGAALPSRPLRPRQRLLAQRHHPLVDAGPPHRRARDARARAHAHAHAHAHHAYHAHHAHHAEHVY
eukprot:2235780-Pleurochrysis_carterae.AAC.2